MRCITGVFLVASLVMCAKKPDAAKMPVVKTVPDTTKTSTIPPPVPPVPAFTIKATDWQFDAAAVPAGAIIYIPAGKRDALLLKNIKGTADKPITVINQGGKVTISATASASYGLKAQNCRFFKILGNGASGVKYGIDVTGANIGITMDDLSTELEIANVEVRNSGFAGIMAKTDPTCDVATQRGHFTMRNIMLHDNYVHQTGGEGFYVGNSFYADGVSLACGKVLPHDVTNVKVYNNIVDSTGCEGIQVGSATAGAEIYNNTVKSPGLKPFAAGQDNGIQIGEGTGGKCYNNLIRNAPGNGIIVLGLGDNLVYNNYILNAGGHGIFADSRYTPGANFQFINNTIIAPALDGIKLNSETVQMNTVINNVIIKQGGIAINKKSGGVKLTALNNYVNADINTCKFVNYSGEDFHLLPSSPLVNAGANALLYGVNIDYYGTERPVGGAFDIGATEY